MSNKFLVYLKNFDWILFASIILLVSFGLAEIYSVALGQGDASFLNFKKQLIFLGIGLAAFFTVAFIDYHYFRSFSNYIYIIGVILLVAVLFFGQTIRGTRGWFQFGGILFQPVEMVKMILILFLARYFSDASLRMNQLKHLVVAGSGFLVFFILVLAQPDFGSAMILFIIWLGLVAAAGFNKKYFLVIFSIIIVLFTSAWSFYLKPYQKQRVMTFINPSFDPLNQGYNVAQAIIAVGAGRLYGRGIGFGSQSQLKFLPESQTDFIFAVIAEELGFSGALLVLAFFAIFLYRCIYNISKVVKDDFGVFFILGGAILIFIQMFINIGMNIGILPVVGISLPFVSYGGSALLSFLIIGGFMESVIIRSKIK